MVGRAQIGGERAPEALFLVETQHPVALVVDHDDDEIEVVLRGGSKLADRVREPRVAAHRDGAPTAGRDTDRRRQREPERSPPQRIRERPRRARPEVSRRPVAGDRHVCDDERVARFVFERPHEPHGRAHPRAALQPLLRGGARRRELARRFRRAHVEHRRERFERFARVGLDDDVGRVVAARVLGHGVDAHARARERQPPSLRIHPVEIATDDEHRASGGDELRHLRLVRRRARGQRMVAPKDALPRERREHRRVERFGHLRERSARARCDRAAAGPDDRRAGVVEHRRGAIERTRFRQHRGGRERLDGRGAHRLVEEVVRDFHEHGASAADERLARGAMDHRRDRLGARDALRPDRHRVHQLALVRILVQREPPAGAVEQPRGDLRRYVQHRRTRGARLAHRARRVRAWMSGWAPPLKNATGISGREARNASKIERLWMPGMPNTTSTPSVSN